MLSFFLDGLGREQKSSIEVVTADAAKWIEELLRRRCPNARWVMDPFHVVEWINDALERVRRDEWQAALMATRQADRQARAAKAQGAARAGKLRERARSLSAEAFRIKGSSYALAKNPQGPERAAEGAALRAEALRGPSCTCMDAQGGS